MALVAHNQTDRQFLENLQPEKLEAFTKWFKELNQFNTNDRVFYANQPLEIATGIECWAGFFEEKLTPQEALDEDYSC